MILRMSRWILILLFALMPLQSVWAASGAYCEHEQEAEAWHFGHHAHSHEADEHEQPKGSSVTHPDCATCALHAKTLAPAALDFAMVPGSFSHTAQPQAAPAASPLTRIERPKWASLAA